MKVSMFTKAVVASAVIGISLTGCSAAEAPTASAESSSPSAAQRSPSQILSSHAWETTAAVDQTGRSVALTDASAANYVGYAYFDADGTFTMYTLQDEPKMRGDWTVTPDGRSRHIVAKGPDGSVMFERDSEITELTDSTFTYRTYPRPDTRAVYVDIVHTRTQHAEPSK
ncbi:DUF4822 domain-containing protein [Tsukamurella sp. 1534]|uniref:DUF4822 domain-containing protein n=1 Tax=Tsukamurella sp. 1534 TaxID=1151061 RepID=UPI0002F5C7A1|nr:DUF4822 domain-containing protein [Tsukamurella sp. 1534]